MGRWIVACGLVLAVMAASTSEARAGEGGCQGTAQDVMVWSIAGLEVGFAGSLALRLTETIKADEGNGELILQLMPWAAGIGAGLSSWCLEISHEGATALHGALWTGFDFFLLGAILDGVDGDSGSLGVGTLVLTSLGVLSGGLFGATQIGDDEEGLGLFLAAAPLAAVVGLGVEMIYAVVDFLSGANTFNEGFIPVAFGVLSLGVGAMTVGPMIMKDHAALGHPDGLPPALAAERFPTPPMLQFQGVW